MREGILKKKASPLEHEEHGGKAVLGRRDSVCKSSPLQHKDQSKERRGHCLQMSGGSPSGRQGSLALS